MQAANPPGPLLTQYNGRELGTLSALLSWMRGDETSEVLEPPQSAISNPDVNVQPLGQEEGLLLFWCDFTAPCWPSRSASDLHVK